MKRAEQRRLEKEQQKANKTIVPYAPLSIEALCRKYPDIVPAVHRFEDKCRKEAMDEASNNIFNLVFSSVLIALHDKNDFNSDQLNQLVSDAINHLDCCSSGFVTKEDLMGLAVELGVKAEKFDLNSVKHNAKQTHGRLKVYFEEVENMKKREMIFKMLDEGETDLNKICLETGAKYDTVRKYRAEWRGKKIEDMTPAEFTDKFYGEDVPEAPKNKPKKEDKESIKEDVKEVVVEQIRNNEGEVKVGLKKIVKVIAIEGEFATYEPTGDNAWTVIIDGQELVLSKDNMRTFADELVQVASEEV